MSTTARLSIDDPVLNDFAAEVGSVGAVTVVGKRTRWHVGGDVDPGARELSAPTGIVEYQPEEMTLRVRAGTPVADLHAAAAEAGQRTALPERGGTVGGAIAVGENDIRALGRGRVREALLQVRYVSSEGRIINSGGPTVKNVSGFDLPRLMVGSLGTLGLLAEVILRTNPIPPVSRWMRAEGASPSAVLEAILAPSAVLYDGTSVWVELVGHAPDVEAEAKNLAGLGVFDDVAGPPELPPHRWSLTPAEVLSIDADLTGPFVAAAELGLVFATNPQPARQVSPPIKEISGRIKTNFDPSGRLNPGRDPNRK